MAIEKTFLLDCVLKNSSRVSSVILPCCVDKRSKGSTSGFVTNQRRRLWRLVLLLMSTNGANAIKTEDLTGQRNMSKLETFLEEGLRSELILQQQLKTLKEALMKQLQETQKEQREELERRIHQNTLLSTYDNHESGDKNKVNQHAKHGDLRRSTAQRQDTLHHPRQSERPNSSPPASVCATSWKHFPDRTTFTPTQLRKEREAEAECQKKFCALPVPSHVTQPLYQEMMELREKERKQGREQRRDFLLSIQKPFNFQEREKEKKEKLIAMLDQVSQDNKNKVAAVKKPPDKEAKDLLKTDSELKDQELCRQVTTLTSVQRESPAVSGSPKLRTADRTRKEKLGFLNERPSFQPKINHQIPDFSRMHRALQTEGLKKTQNKDGIKCQPFHLRTAALPARQSRISSEPLQIPRPSQLCRSKSMGALTSLSTDTLPTFITDAVRKRCMAIRKSMELRESKNQESVDWLRKFHMRSQVMQKTVSLHARLLDPHSSLKEVCHEKLQQHWEADNQRMREYMKELRNMKARVSERPYLFEQVTQKNAKAHAEQTYRNKLKKAGLKEQFVEEKGEATSSRSDEDIDQNDIQSRDENVDDGEKIEDVDEKSVKSKGEML
ncbi:protein FAM161B isoform X2 [Labrus mixtus]|uniref:protein FAM161B isoform X2 n=1 Tax=Labrus mixtus TaxID=508554 RepID=UPI0029C0687C|nr:protein FAM161B isoform X2 [Labrus mixtus]